MRTSSRIANSRIREQNAVLNSVLRAFSMAYGWPPLCYTKKLRRAVMNVKRSKLITIVAFAFGSVALFAFVALSGDEHSSKVKEGAAQSAKAAKVLDAIMQAPDKGIPNDLLRRSKAIAVFPQVIKAAFVVGGEGGRGVVSRHTNAGWDNPVFLRAGGPSVGWQIGASATDFVLLFMNDEAISGLMKDKFELGADVGVAGGPVGREAGAGTDALMQAQILSYSRSRGLFAGISLKGIVVRPEDGLNQAIYGKTARELLSEDKHAGTASQGGLLAFPQAIDRYTSPETKR
jgi:SH3 domain-containing YSC84-like protein 1